MTTSSSLDHRIAARLRDSHVQLAADWLARLRALLAVPTEEIFPNDSLLDHIPALIIQIADYLDAPADHALVANTAVMTKAKELGELRFEQQASIHQLLREYRLLDEVLTAFVRREVSRESLIASHPEVVDVIARMNESVSVLLQTTVDTFVSRYSETIASQTTRLEGFNRMVSHELRQPLGAVRSAVEILKTDAPPLDESVRRRCLQTIESSTRRMATLTNALLTLSAAGSDALQVQPIDLARLVADVASQLAEMAERRGVHVRIDVPSVTITTDVARLELVLINLVSNAIKYSDPLKAERFVEIAAVVEGEFARLSVHDNGLGIPDGDRGRVFDGFFRAHARRDVELGADGLGLGLAIVAECLRYLRGTVEVTSQDGVGTRFDVRLPLGRASDRPTA